MKHYKNKKTDKGRDKKTKQILYVKN